MVAFINFCIGLSMLMPKLLKKIKILGDEDLTVNHSLTGLEINPTFEDKTSDVDVELIISTPLDESEESDKSLTTLVIILLVGVFTVLILLTCFILSLILPDQLAISIGGVVGLLGLLYFMYGIKVEPFIKQENNDKRTTGTPPDQPGETSDGRTT